MKISDRPGSNRAEALIELIESAHKRSRLMALAESANDQRANVNEPVTEHIVMDTSANGSAIISDGTGTMPALRPEKIEISPGVGGREVDAPGPQKDEGIPWNYKGFCPRTAQRAPRPHANSSRGIALKKKLAFSSRTRRWSVTAIEFTDGKTAQRTPRMVAIVASRRDDGEMLMDLINRGHVYRFLLKPVSPGRSRLAIEASVKHHMEAPEEAFKPKTGFLSWPKTDKKAEARAKAAAEAKAKADAKAKAAAEAKAKAEADARRAAEAKAEAKLS